MSLYPIEFLLPSVHFNKFNHKTLLAFIDLLGKNPQFVIK
ncbi:hypothetical protein HMPREF9378_0541 [Streptococcus sanguinis SK1 = NCTC 7863]|uniref:Uncharacterized protein n=2 Tax=Streptococcus sanguinis TaxID=1305 RepID=F3SHH2_STRSA|nr:hypothetical protein HMPREF9383_1228 [Streptococcus sanguinis SK150]EGF08464.1 hypothetical protein HMPREF9378_0541 [Streptococcus sanguinis SK1 = NCTC 7863]EGF21609.1 hypothetical protein HMPREF9395_1136 [Streptococcus sanguinis SK1058]EGG40381.1 hypothetical protein HMPREF9397_0594 [Streptococcus sanguinis SK1087]